MKKKLIAIIAVFIVITSLTIVLLITKNEEGLPELKADDISRVYYEGLDNEFIKDLDIEEFLGYYNQIHDVVENKYGEAMEAKEIVIELKDGQIIHIDNVGDQFDIEFKNSDGESKHYFGKQQEIDNMLRYGFYRLGN